MTFSKETLEAKMNSLTPEEAMRMVALAGSAAELNRLLEGLTRNFNATLPAAARCAIKEGTRRWYGACRSTAVNYKVAV